MEEKRIKSKYIAAGFICLAVFAICMVIGFVVGLFLIPAALSGIVYLLIDKKYLRCPYCRTFTNMDKLLYAKKHPYHCSNCGKLISIEK